MVEAELHCFVNVSGRRDALLQHVESLIADHGVDAACNEARRFFDDYRVFAHASANLDRRRNRVSISLQAAHNFQQLHLVHRIEEMHAQALGRAVGYR